ncbi:uncharacterized protein LOC132196929 isoform X2 [Neocloeon triangulifer]|uniref:uncharacterized protein LOC132196929 isoform X2 n=1 Tax=Neocloeon triangulifer TaxID=2078957 RepID=UPI00286EFAE4|nr:uncharacterized protein LOC132196929 isoform X2 [Neocloeon triangulifer]
MASFSNMKSKTRGKIRDINSFAKQIISGGVVRPRRFLPRMSLTSASDLSCSSPNGALKPSRTSKTDVKAALQENIKLTTINSQPRVVIRRIIEESPELSDSEQDEKPSSSNRLVPAKKAKLDLQDTKTAIKHTKTKVDLKQESVQLHSSSMSSTLQEDVSSCLGRHRNRINQSLNASFISLGNIKLNETMASLPEWFSEVQKKRSKEPSQIQVKIDYKSSPADAQKWDSFDKKLMPPPSAPSEKFYEQKIRIQDQKNSSHKISNWFLGFSPNGCAVIQGLDNDRNKTIKTTDIVSVTNFREVKTARSSYILVGPMDEKKWKKQLPPGYEHHFVDGFPENWREITHKIKSDLNCTLTDAPTSPENEFSSDRRLGNEPMQVKSLKSVHEELSSVNYVSWNERVKNKLRTVQSKSAVPNAQVDLDNVSLNMKFSDSESDTERASKKCAPEESIDDAEIVRLIKWRPAKVVNCGKVSFVLRGYIIDGKGRVKKSVEIPFENISPENSTSCILRSIDKLFEYHLIGKLYADRSMPEHMRRKFESGFPDEYMHYLLQWDEMDESIELAGAMSKSRFGRAVNLPVKFRDIQQDISSVEDVQSGKKQRILSRTNLQQPVLHEGDVNILALKGNTLKAAKKRAEIKNKLRAEVTTLDVDFFHHASEFESQTEDEFPNTTKKTPMRKNKLNRMLSPMAEFASKQVEDEKPRSESEEEESVKPRDKRKVKTFKKFVYHEEMQHYTKPKANEQKKVLPKVAKFRSTDIRCMKEYLEKEQRRKCRIDNKLKLGDNSDFSEEED